MRILILSLLTLVVIACSSKSSKLRSELQSVEAEMSRIVASADQYRSAMSQAEFDSFVGSFFAGYGAVSGDAELARDGAVSAYDSNAQHGAARSALIQLQRRYAGLARRREEIVRLLR